MYPMGQIQNIWCKLKCILLLGISMQSVCNAQGIYRYCTNTKPQLVLSPAGLKAKNSCIELNTTSNWLLLTTVMELTMNCQAAMVTSFAKSSVGWDV